MDVAPTEVMLRTVALAGAGSFVLAGSVPLVATAAPGRASNPPALQPVPPVDTYVAGHVGGFGDRSQNGGLLIGGTALIRVGLPEGGLLFERGDAFSDYRFSAFGILLGVCIRPVSVFRLDLLGAVGMHYYTGVGHNELTFFGSDDDPGVDRTMYYAGGRVGISYLFSYGLNHFSLGSFVGFDDDLMRDTVRYHYVQRGWLSGTSEVVETEHHIGFVRTSVVIALGGTHDLW